MKNDFCLYIDVQMTKTEAVRAKIAHCPNL